MDQQGQSASHVSHHDSHQADIDMTREYLSRLRARLESNGSLHADQSTAVCRRDVIESMSQVYGSRVVDSRRSSIDACQAYIDRLMTIAADSRAGSQSGDDGVLECIDRLIFQADSSVSGGLDDEFKHQGIV